jgi:membrane protein YqaA with SNARE-associated domain
MPPTWTLLSIVGFNFNLSISYLIIFSILAAVASTLGRSILILFSNKIIRNRFLSKRILENVNFLKIKIEEKKGIAYGFFLLFAFSPFPSGPLFLAYGLTGLRLRIAMIPFFIGRSISYLFWALTASNVSERITINAFRSGAYFSIYFILTQIILIFLVYLFAKINWKVLYTKHKISFLE